MVNHLFADFVVTNGVVYTVDSGDSVAEAVAVKGDRIICVGSDREISGFIGEKTHRIDLCGQMVIPGMIDTHMHPPGAALAELYEVILTGIPTLQGYFKAVTDFIHRNPETKLVYGRGWSWGILNGEESHKGPRKEYLDAISKDIPIVLRADDGHSLWVNSKALEVNGITRDTAAPAGGMIVKDPGTGELWGTLKESAMRLIATPEYSYEQYLDAMVRFQQQMHRLGITGALCLGGPTFPVIFQVCAELQQRGELAFRIRGALTIQPSDDVKERLAMIRVLQARSDTAKLGVRTVKFFADGVIEGGTGFLLKPYTLETGRGADYYGEFLWDTEKLKEAVCAANRAGLQVHVHSTGDGSIQRVLDVFEAVRMELGKDDCRNTITHLQLVDAMDIPRFKDLDVIASVQPYWHFKSPNWWLPVDYRVLGERAEREYPLQSLFDAGVVVTSSSDYPITHVPNPLLAIETGVTRNMPQGEMYGLDDIEGADDERYLLNAKERATVRQMIRSFTMNSAYCMFMDREIGSIETGKLADMVVLDRDLLSIDPLDIDKAEVVMTFFNGEMVYQRPE